MPKLKNVLKIFFLKYKCKEKIYNKIKKKNKIKWVRVFYVYKYIFFNLKNGYVSKPETLMLSKHIHFLG